MQLGYFWREMRCAPLRADLIPARREILFGSKDPPAVAGTEPRDLSPAQAHEYKKICQFLEEQETDLFSDVMNSICGMITLEQDVVHGSMMYYTDSDSNKVLELQKLANMKHELV